MPIEILVAVVTAVGIILAAIVGADRFRPGKSASLRKDIEIYSLLPDDLTAKKEMKAYLESKIMDYVSYMDENRRNPMEVGIGSVFLLLCMGSLALFIKLGGLWLIGLVISFCFFIIGVYGFQRGARKAKRDEKGNPIPSIKYQESNSSK